MRASATRGSQLVALCLAACAEPAEPSAEVAAPAPLPVVYARPYVVKAELPARFHAALPTTVRELDGDPLSLPPVPAVRAALATGDPATEQRLLVAVRTVASRGAVPEALVAYYASLFGYRPAAPACDFLFGLVTGDEPRPVRNLFWPTFARCNDGRFAAAFQRADAPDQTVIDWYFDAAEHDRLPFTPRLMRAAVSVARSARWYDARKVGFALAHVSGPQALRAVTAVQQKVAPPRRALIGIGLYGRPEPEARALFARACRHPAVRADPVCRPAEPGWERAARPTGLAADVRAWGESTANLISRHGAEPVLAALEACIAEGEYQGERIHCLERLARARRERAVAIAKTLAVKDFDFQWAREVVTTLQNHADAASLPGRLEALGLLPRPPAGDGETPLTTTDFLVAAGSGASFDTETDQFPNEHDALLADLARLVQPALDAVRFEELPPQREGEPYLLRAYFNGRKAELSAQNYGDWYDVEAVLGLVNFLLRAHQSPTRLISLPTGDQTALLVAGPETGLNAAVAEGLLSLAEPDEGMRDGKEFEEKVRLEAFGDGAAEP